jgi:hypothetical protein
MWLKLLISAFQRRGLLIQIIADVCVIELSTQIEGFMNLQCRCLCHRIVDANFYEPSIDLEVVKVHFIIIIIIKCKINSC